MLCLPRKAVRFQSPLTAEPEFDAAMARARQEPSAASQDGNPFPLLRDEDVRPLECGDSSPLSLSLGGDASFQGPPPQQEKESDDESSHSKTVNGDKTRRLPAAAVEPYTGPHPPRDLAQATRVAYPGGHP